MKRKRRRAREMYVDLKDGYTWPFGYHAFCWWQERLFFLYLNGYGFIFLLAENGPKLARAMDATDPRHQQVADYRSLAPQVKRDIMKTAYRAWNISVQAYKGRFHRLPTPAIPETFPNTKPLMTEGLWRIGLFHSQQSEYLH